MTNEPDTSVGQVRPIKPWEILVMFWGLLAAITVLLLLLLASDARDLRAEKARVARSVPLSESRPVFVSPSLAGRLDAGRLASLESQVRASGRPIRLAILDAEALDVTYYVTRPEIPGVIGATAVVVFDLAEETPGEVQRTATGERFALYAGRIDDERRPFEAEDEAVLAREMHGTEGALPTLADLAARLIQNTSG